MKMHQDQDRDLARQFAHARPSCAAALALALLAIPQFGHAQGIVRGAQEGAYEGNRVAGPVGGVVGGAVGAGVGGAIGAVDGVLGIPYRGRAAAAAFTTATTVSIAIGNS